MINFKTKVIKSVKTDFEKKQLLDFLFNLNKNSIWLLLILLICNTSHSKNYFQKNNSLFTYENNFRDGDLAVTNAKSPDTLTKRQMSASKKQTADTTNERIIINLSELDKVAEYPGGIEKFYAKVSSNLDEYELNYKVFTEIHVSFVIEKDGSMDKIVIDSKIDADLKKEIIDGLKSIKTKWSPALINNQPVRIAYSLPIVLNLE